MTISREKLQLEVEGALGLWRVWVRRFVARMAKRCYGVPLLRPSQKREGALVRLMILPEPGVPTVGPISVRLSAVRPLNRSRTIRYTYI